MSDRPTIEDVLADCTLAREQEQDWHGWGESDVASVITDLHAATEDGPIRSADGTLVVHRADPELAAFLQRHIDNLPVNTHAAIGWKLNKIVRLVAGDPEEEK